MPLARRRTGITISPTARRVLTVTAVAVGSVLAAATVAVAGLHLAHGDILPGVTVEGVDLGDADDEEARERLASVVDARRRDDVTFTFRDREFVLQAATAGYEVDLPATIERARRIGRTGGLVSRSWAHVAALWREVPIELVQRVDDRQLETWVASVAAELDRSPFPGAITADPATLEVAVEAPDEGREVDQDATAQRARSALTTPGADRIDLPVTVTPPRIQTHQVQAVAEIARAALQEPLVLSAVGAQAVLTPKELAPLLGLREVGQASDQGTAWDVELAVPVDAVEELFGERAQRFEVEPLDAGFDVPRVPPTTLDDKDDTSWTARPVQVPIVPSRTGQTFDAELAAAQIVEVLAGGRHAAELRLRPVEPDFTTEEARALGIDQLIGTFTSYHAAGQGRVTNIQRLADLVDGAVVEPGEQFSINQISGERTCSKGFVAAGMILNGELVDVCGGGVSQFGTTTFNAAFFAGLPIDQYKAHSWYISRYPMGREATLNYPSPDIDVRFTNDTGAGILVRTSYTPTSITVSLYGNNGGKTVRAIHGKPDNYRGYSTRYRENKSLAPGSARVVQSGAQGFDVTVIRVIEQGGSELDRESFFTRYVPITEIIERNTSSAPPPPPPPPPDGGGDGGTTGDGGTDGGGDAGADGEPPGDGG